MNLAPVWEFVTQRYRLTTFLSMMVLILVAAGAARLTFTPDFRTYFSDDNPQLQSFEALEDAFNKRDNVSLILSPVNGDIYDPRFLALVVELTELAWQTPYSRRVDSLSNHQHLQATVEGLSASDLIDEGVLADEQALRAVRDYASEEETLLHSIVSPDGKATAINVTLTLPADNVKATGEVVTWLREQLAPIQEANKDKATIQLFGSAVINLALEEAVAGDLALLIPVSTLLMYVLLVILLRSWTGMLITMSVITLSIVAVFGLAGWAGGALTPVAGIIPNMVMIIAVADCVHLLVSFYHYLSEGQERREAVVSALRINFKPMLITSVTTAIGLLCLNFSEAPPYRALGNMAASGALIAFLLTITLAPALMCWLPPGRKSSQGHGSARLYPVMQKLADMIIARRYLTLAISAAVVVVCASLISQNKMYERWYVYYDDSFAVRKAMEFSDEHLSGINFIQYRIDGVGPGTINDPEYLQQLDQLVAWIETQPGVTNVDSIVPSLRRVHRLLNTGSEDDSRLPESRERAAQNLLLYEMSLPFGLGTDEYLNIDRSAARIGVFVHKTDSRTLLALDETIRRWAEGNTPVLSLSEGTGLDMVFAHISDRNMISLLQGTAIALVLISLLLAPVVRSWRIGVVSLVPNLVPALVAYGIWGITVGYVDLGLSVVACMSLGLVVDDTIHFLSKYVLARRELGKSPEDAIRYAFGTVGTAMLVTTVVLAAGFAILVLSPFSPTWGMGGLLSLTIVAALVFDFLLVPPLLLLVDRDR
ncbi:efflux RND transporter permease subunit [Alcanivorax sediminis]|uniref:MMPL family transporter n=1 Tax=Alcanivorax sediminis TaxID=2663008 RepID=A0A6N7LUA4_9GAMM|nr:efflux RND transporter permease subunit [Alcanivorax sediminis]MQX51670.1 MMPL family transporter [Alcanivorax sediminis]